MVSRQYTETQITLSASNVWVYAAKASPNRTYLGFFLSNQGVGNVQLSTSTRTPQGGGVLLFGNVAPSVPRFELWPKHGALLQAEWYVSASNVLSPAIVIDVLESQEYEITTHGGILLGSMGPIRTQLADASKARVRVAARGLHDAVNAFRAAYSGRRLDN